MRKLRKDQNIIYKMLFDRRDTVLYWRTVFHTLGFFHNFCVGIIAHYISIEIAKHPNPDVTVLYRFRTAFITSWIFIFQTLFLGLSAFYDVLVWLDKRESTLATRIKYWLDVSFCSIVVPVTIFVSSTFWCVYAIDREMVLPKIYDEVVPWWLNHCSHTIITVVIILETILQARRRATNRKLELILYWTVAFSYTILYYTIYFFTNQWLYRVSGTISWRQAFFYTTLILVLVYLFYELQFPINRLLHKEENDGTEEKEHKKEETKQNVPKNLNMKFRNVNRNKSTRSFENFAN